MGVIMTPKWVPLWHVPLFQKGTTGAAETMIGLAPVVAPTREEAREIAEAHYGEEDIIIGGLISQRKKVLTNGD